jgi:hypothetical protein
MRFFLCLVYIDTIVYDDDDDDDDDHQIPKSYPKITAEDDDHSDNEVIGFSSMV